MRSEYQMRAKTALFKIITSLHGFNHVACTWNWETYEDKVCKKTYMTTIISKYIEKGSLVLQYGEPQDCDEIYEFTLSMGF